LYGAPRRTWVIPHGRSRRRPFATKRDYALTIGRQWDEAQNLRVLDAAAAELPWPVYVASRTRSPHRTSNGFKHLALLGESQRDLASWLNNAAIYACPARYEPFGLSVLEAAQAGCALVLGDIPNLREMWDGVARFVAPGDPAELHDSLKNLIDDPATRSRLGTHAAVRAQSFDSERTAREYARLYQRLTRNRSSRPPPPGRS
jgi:glycosyltransferase involved in cell wall biosynthesis